MSQDMNRAVGNGYTYLANTRPRVAGLRNYLGQRLASAANYSTSAIQPTPGDQGEAEEKQGWRAWAGEKARRWRGGPSSEVLPDSVERIRLFPGWATRRYSKEEPTDGTSRSLVGMV